MHFGTGSSKLVTIDIDGGSDVYPSSDVPLSVPATTGATIADTVSTADGTQDIDSGIRPEGPSDDTA